jgi:conjugative transfer region lipoprotein (TIGR03751 family)
MLAVVLTCTLINCLGGCSTKDRILPVPENDMKAVYNMHMQGIDSGKLFDARSLMRRPMTENDVALSEYVRSEKNQLQARFQTLPNPMLYMFVAPHLAADSEVPIPGYLTQFRMWEKDHFALPGERSDMSTKYQGE